VRITAKNSKSVQRIKCVRARYVNYFLRLFFSIQTINMICPFNWIKMNCYKV